MLAIRQLGLDDEAMELLPRSELAIRVQKYFEWRSIYDDQFPKSMNKEILAKDEVVGGIAKVYDNLLQTFLADPLLVSGYVWPNMCTDGFRIVDKVFGDRTDGLIVKIEDAISYQTSSGISDYCLVMKSSDQTTIYGLLSELELSELPDRIGDIE